MMKWTMKFFFQLKTNEFNKFKEKMDENLKLFMILMIILIVREGVEGYTSLFRSRFEKSLRILSLRQDSKRIKKIESLSNFLINQT